MCRSEPVSMDEKTRTDFAAIKEAMKEIKEMLLDLKKSGEKFKGWKNSMKEKEKKEVRLVYNNKVKEDEEEEVKEEEKEVRLVHNNKLKEMKKRRRNLG